MDIQDVNDRVCRLENKVDDTTEKTRDEINILKDEVNIVKNDQTESSVLIKIIQDELKYNREERQEESKANREEREENRKILQNIHISITEINANMKEMYNNQTKFEERQAKIEDKVNKTDDKSKIDVWSYIKLAISGLIAIGIGYLIPVLQHKP